MTELAQRLTARAPILGGSVERAQQRLRVAPDAYRAADRGLWVATGAIMVVVALLPMFAGSAHVLLAQQSLYLGLLALSLNLLVATTGLVSFGHAMFYALGGYLVAVPFAQSISILEHPLYAFALTPIMGAVSGLVIGLIVFRGRELYFALLTLGAGQLIWAVAHGWQSLTGGTNGIPGVFSADWLNPFQHSRQLYWFVFGCCLVCAVALYVITKSPFGDALRGIRENRRRAEFAGLWVKRYEVTAFVIAGAFGSIAGGLSVIGETQINSDLVDWRRSALALIAVLLGGTRYFLGPFAGAFFYLFVFDWVIQKTPELWDTVLGLAVLGVALLLPAGIAGMIHWLLAQGGVLLQRLRGGPAAAPVVAVALAGDGQEEVHLPELAEVRAATPASTDGHGPPVLELNNLTKSFGGLVAVDDVSLHVRQGAIHAIIGPNGAGKTTLFNVVTGLMKPDSGQVVLEGEDITGTAPWRLVKRGMGRSFQTTNLFWALSSLDNVTLAEAAVKDATWKLHGGHKSSIRERARDLLDRVGLGPFAGFAANELSHGDQRSLEIATALAVESRFLLLDEPTAGLSPRETKAAVALIQKIAREEQLTLLFVEHDMEVVFGIADWITVLHRGAVLAEGPPAEIRANPDVQRAYLGEVEEEEGVAG
jgi:ABC-type branched-subunit amino acid transport system ATPase component/ABC-type branched-subunit amino acid transport system permease subunit